MLLGMFRLQSGAASRLCSKKLRRKAMLEVPLWPFAPWRILDHRGAMTTQVRCKHRSKFAQLLLLLSVHFLQPAAENSACYHAQHGLMLPGGTALSAGLCNSCLGHLRVKGHQMRIS